MSSSNPLAAALIPSAGVHITESRYPQGFYVARYDGDGFAVAPRWFPTIDKARAYATELKAAA